MQLCHSNFRTTIKPLITHTCSALHFSILLYRMIYITVMLSSILQLWMLQCQWHWSIHSWKMMIFLVLFPYLICGFTVLNQASICLCQARLGYIHCTMKWDGKLMKSSVIRSLLCHQVYLGNSHESVFSALLAFFMENPLIGWLHIQRVSMAHRFCDTKLWILL